MREDWLVLGFLVALLGAYLGGWLAGYNVEMGETCGHKLLE